MSVTVLTEAPETADHHRMRAGFRAMTPVVAAYAPFALVVGTAVATSADPWSAWIGTWLVYGGAAQVAVLDVLATAAAGSPPRPSG